MNVLILQQAGEHVQDLDSKESSVFQRYFKLHGIDSIVSGLNHGNFSNIKNLIDECDAIFLLENYEINGWIPDLSKVNKLKIFWTMDSHLALENHINLCNKHKINIVLHGIHDHNLYFKDYKTYYFPLACIPEKTRPLKDINKIYDVGFCGSLIFDRPKWLDLLDRNFNLKRDIMVLGENMVKAINSYKIHFNKTISPEGVNARVVQTLACNTFLITNKTNDMKYQFKPGKHFITYENEHELIEKINFYLENYEIAERISLEGYNHVLKYHTFENRVQELIKIIKENI